MRSVPMPRSAKAFVGGASRSYDDCCMTTRNDEIQPAAASEPMLFDAVLYPHRSLGPRAFLLLMACIAGVSFIAGIVFLIAGAWPVFGFLGLDVLLVYWAFMASYRSGRLHEIVRLTPKMLTVERRHPGGRVQSWSFQPYWLRVDIDDPPEHESQIVLSSHGRSLAIGSFLSPDERGDLARALRRALAQARSATAG